MTIATFIGKAARVTPVVGTALGVKDLVTGSPDQAPSWDGYAPSPMPPNKKRRGKVALIVAIVLAVMTVLAFAALGLLLLLRSLGIISITLPFDKTQTVTVPTVVVPHFVIDDKYQIMHEVTQFSVDNTQCRQFTIDSCASGTLSAAAKANVTQSLVLGKDYVVAAEFNGHYATAGKMGDVKLAITIWTQPSIADPDWDVNLITRSIKYMDTSSTLAGLWGTSVTQSQLEELAQSEAVKYAQTDPSLYEAARRKVITKVTQDAIAWGKVFGYVVHPTVVFGLRPGDR